MSEQVQFEEDSFGGGSGPAGSGRSFSQNSSGMERWLMDRGIVTSPAGARSVLIGVVIFNLIVVYLVIRYFVI
ncbi:MAG: hypothetical protein A3D50_02265 [Candidatus Taylorbacteria bacterium RIFCSPHIGHO2_02_FULL_44_12]|nr:MAG: hypothetical protein A3D50_02265 [Candidatus Taylorbacteria bacterium RIFCSPHIGHO2_02_FULL_44_12]